MQQHFKTKNMEKRPTKYLKIIIKTKHTVCLGHQKQVKLKTK